MLSHVKLVKFIERLRSKLYSIYVVRATKRLRNKYYFSFIDLPPRVHQVSLETIPLQPKRVLAISIAFNSPKTIEKQLTQIQEFCADDFEIVVCDNSTTNHSAREIQRTCDLQGVEYYRLPVNPFSGKFHAMSHGSALDWVLKNVITVRIPEWILFLDHDVWPTSEVDIPNLLEAMKNKSAHGIVVDSSDGWYMWPGFLWIHCASQNLRHLSLMPTLGVTDTGGEGWHTLYKFLDPTLVSSVEVGFRKIGKGDSPQIDYIQILDQQWLHLINGSGWSDGVEKYKRVIDC